MKLITLFALLPLMFSHARTLAYPFFPKDYLMVGDHFQVLDLRASLADPTIEDYRAREMHWPFSSSHSGKLEDMIERSFHKSFVSTHSDFFNEPKTVYAAFKIEITQRAVGPVPYAWKNFRYKNTVEANLFVIPLKTGVRIGPIPLTFDLVRIAEYSFASVSFTKVNGIDVGQDVATNAAHLNEAFFSLRAACAPKLDESKPL